MARLTGNAVGLAAVVALLLSSARSTRGHSWLECTDMDLQNNTCRGYQRGWNAQHIDTEMTYRILNRENVPACFPGKQDSGRYTDRFPMAVGRPGQTLTFTYLENGHTTKDRLPTKPDPKSYTMHWSAAADKDTILMRSDLTAQNQLGPARSFDDGECSEDGAQPGRVKRPCRGSFTIPEDATPGRHQIVWWWKFDRAGPEEYTACFDVLVKGESEKQYTSSDPNEHAVPRKRNCSDSYRTLRHNSQYPTRLPRPPPI